MTPQDWREIIEHVNRTCPPAGLFINGEWVEFPETDPPAPPLYRGGRAPHRYRRPYGRRARQKEVE